MTLPRQPGAEQHRLQLLVGSWSTVGRVEATASEPPGRLKATDTYEWLPGGFFLLHQVEGRMGDAEVHVLEVIGGDDAGGYVTWSFDNQGQASEYRARIEGRSWTVVGGSERFSGAFGEDGRTLAGRWERMDNGRWVPWMEVTLTKD